MAARPTIHIHHRHLLLLSPKADNHFTVPQRVKADALQVQEGCAAQPVTALPCISLGAQGCTSQWLS